jgi:ribonuclease BN (tRNA processing enzyme)
VKLTIIGCSGSVPGPDSAASSYLVEHDGFRLLLDLGSGAFGPLQRHLDPADVDAVVLSHLHPDHFFDVAPMVVHRRHGMTGARRIPLLGPAGTHDRLAMAYDPASRAGLRDLFEVAAVTPGERELGPFRLRFERVNHPVETHAVRVSAAGRALAYSADTGVSDGLVALARDADLLLCEASFDPGPGNPPNLHLTGAQAGQHAARAGVGRLLVTHVPPWTDPARARDDAAAAYAGPVELAAAGAAYDLQDLRSGTTSSPAGPLAAHDL